MVEILINANSTKPYSSGHGINVTEEKPWDKLSQAFKKYTHTIEYTASGGYVSSNYKISVYTGLSRGHREFEYIKPTVKVTAVEVFFGANDNVNSKEPLILGFVYERSCECDNSNTSSKCYYTWSELKSKRGRNKQYTNNLKNVDSVKGNDLITRLLEELGNRDSSLNRKNKLVIRVDERPGSSSSTYPESGNNRGKITVTKSTGGVLAGLTGYEGYEHTFSLFTGGVSDLYVSYQNNSRFFNTGSSAKIQKVTAYYEDVTVSSEKKLVLITFYLTSRSTREYKYFDFVNHLKEDKDKKKWPTEAKKLSELQTISVYLVGGSNLKTRLPEETERLRQFIAFKEGDKSNENITPKESKVGSYDTFKKITMEPNKQDPDVVGGKSVGPWYVHSGKLFTDERSEIIDHSAKIGGSGNVLAGVTTGNVTSGSSKKYNTITVYYYVKTGGTSGSGNTGDKKALLVEFDQAPTGDHIRGRGSGSSDGTKVYFKRTNKEGDKWADASTDITDGKVDALKLVVIAKDAGIIGSSSTLTAKVIQIETNRIGGTFRIGDGGGQINVNVTGGNPWDPLSKVFKKYTHTIQYPRSGSSRVGHPWDYSITLVGPRSTSGSNEFMYKKLEQWVQDVELYFKATDNPSDSNPLVVGFVSRNWREGNRSKGCPSSSRTGRGSKCYYTWSYLTTGGGINGFTGDVDDKNAIMDKDLIHGLFDELGRTTGGGGTGQNKVVIRLDEQSTNNSLTYPESKYFTEGVGKSSINRQVTVKKLENTGGGGDTGYVTGYDVYEHSVIGGTTSSDTDDSSYVTYQNDSKRIQVDFRLGADVRTGSLKKVRVYYKGASSSINYGGGSDKPVLIVFSFTGTSSTGSIYGYSYQDFVNDLKNQTQRVNPKTITSSDGIKGGPSDIKGKLQGEIERLVPLIEFRSGGSTSGPLSTTTGTSRHENIKITGLVEVVRGEGQATTEGYTFQKVSMTPNKTDNDVPGGISVGPWTVYNDYLFTDNKGETIDDSAKIGGDGGGVLDGITTNEVTDSRSKKYSGITVYYAIKGSGTDTSDNWALLVKFDQAGSRTDGRVSSVGGETMLYYKRENQKGDKWAIAGEIGTGSDSELLPKLRQQWDNFRPLIDFKLGSGGRDVGPDGHKHVRQESEQVTGGSEAFNKVTFKPDTGEGGSPKGPWEVYSEHFLGSESDKGTEIQPESVLKDIFTNGDGGSSNKYSSISVYYTSNKMALLVEFCAGDGTIKYFKRTNQDGTEWADANSDISGGKVDESVLTSIAKEAGVIGGLGPGEAAGIGLSVTGLGGAGVGFAIYKNFAAVSALIGRIF